MTSIRNLKIYSLFVFMALCCIVLLTTRSAYAYYGTGAEIPKDYTCISCHTDLSGGLPIDQLDKDVLRLYLPVVDWKASRHWVNGIACADCHGGNTKDMALAKEPSEGYIGKPPKQEVPNICGGKCHSSANADKMKNEFGSLLRTDQLDLYHKSFHYQRLTEGNPIAPVCTDCHTKHKIEVPRNNKSMAESCFFCHTNTVKNLKGGAHWISYQDQNKKTPICRNCHGNHDVMKSSTAQYDGTDTTRDCVACHAKDTNAYKVGLEIKALRENAIEANKKGHEDVELLHKKTGAVTFALQDILKKSDEDLAYFASMTHSLDLEKIKAESERIVKEVETIYTETDKYMIRDAAIKKWFIIMVVVFLGLIIFGWMLSKNVERIRHREDK